jgi:hypothetical protein
LHEGVFFGWKPIWELKWVCVRLLADVYRG